MGESAAEVQKYWSVIRQGAKAKQSVAAARRRRRVRSSYTWLTVSATSSTLPTHRLAIERDCWPGTGNAERRQLLNEAAAQYDQWTSDNSARAKRRSSGRGGKRNITVGKNAQ